MSWSVLFLCICVCVTTFATQVPPKEQPPLTFRNDYTYSDAFKMYYKEHREMLRWKDAVMACSLEGAALAVPSSVDEMNFLLKFMRTDTAHVWLGLHDLYMEMNYMTIDGLPATDVYMNYQNHHQGSTARDCVKMTRAGFYQDTNCDTVERFICKADLSLYNDKCGTYDKGYKKYPSMGEYCHKLHTTPETWHDAFKICAAEQAQLVIINSAEEAKLCAALFNQLRGKGNFDKNYIHIGFNDLIISGKYLTIDGKTIEESGFSSWASGQPDNLGQNEHCGTLKIDVQLLNDIKCTLHKYLFVCEKKINYETYSGNPLCSLYQPLFSQCCHLSN